MSLITSSSQRYYVNNPGICSDNLEEVSKKEFLNRQARKGTSSSSGNQKAATALALLTFASQFSPNYAKCVGATCTTTLSTVTPLTTTTPQPTFPPTTTIPPTTTTSTTRLPTFTSQTTTPITPTTTSKTGLTTTSALTLNMTPPPSVTTSTSTLDQTGVTGQKTSATGMTSISGATPIIPGVTTSVPGATSSTSAHDLTATTSVSTLDQTAEVGMTRSTSMPNLVSTTEDTPNASQETATNSSLSTVPDAVNESLDQKTSTPPDNSGLIVGAVFGAGAFVASVIASVAVFLKIKSKNKEDQPELGREYPELEANGIPGYDKFPPPNEIRGDSSEPLPDSNSKQGPHSNYDKLRLQSDKKGRYNLVQVGPDSPYKSAFANRDNNKGYDEATSKFKTGEEVDTSTLAKKDYEEATSALKTGDEELASARMDDEETTTPAKQHYVQATDKFEY